MIRKVLSAVLVFALTLGFASSAFAESSANEQAKQQFEQDIVKLQPYLKIDKDGYFQVTATSAKQAGVSPQTYTAVKLQFTEINRELHKLTPGERSQMFQGNSAGEVNPSRVTCTQVYVSKWALRAFAWFVIIVGGAFATAGLFASATIVGLPAGAVLGALAIWTGITGTALLWYADNFYTGRYVRVCF